MAFYLYDPGDGYTEYQNIEAAMREASNLIDIYRDQCAPEWPEYVDGITIYESDDPEETYEGRMVARSVVCNRIDRPDDTDEDGYSPSVGMYFDAVDFYCDYKMEAA